MDAATEIALIAHRTMDIDMDVGIMVTTMYTDASLAATRVAAVWIDGRNHN